MPTAPLVARKTITTIQDGSVYKDRFTLSTEQPPGTTVRQVWLDSAGADIAEIEGEVDRYTISFQRPYADVAEVPNGAGFYTYIHYPDEPLTDEHLVRYGSTFRRELTFPSSPAQASNTVVRLFEDNFQRPPGKVGGRWKVLVGRPRIFDNSGTKPNSVGPDYNFFSQYFMYYYQPFNDDSTEISFTMLDKGTGNTFISLCCNSQATSYLYVALNSGTNKAVIGYGTGPDIGNALFPTGVLHAQITPVNLTTPGTGATYKILYDDETRTCGLYNFDKTTKYCEWEDEGGIVPHGKGYRYFGIGATAGLLDSGNQVANIRAAGVV